MTISRLLILQLVLLLGFGAVVLVPRNPRITPCAVSMELPANLGMWTGTDEQVSERELELLAHDTEFARKLYRSPFEDQLFASVVLSGHDLDNSIHRPERCLPAQGWTIVDARMAAIKVPNAPGGRLEVMRLHNSRPFKMDNGELRTMYNLNYYWFVGSNALTASHLQRTFIDIRDRLLFGHNQRWAYITVASTIGEGLMRFGRSEEETDKLLQAFIAQLYPEVVTNLGPRD